MIYFFTKKRINKMNLIELKYPYYGIGEVCRNAIRVSGKHIMPYERYLYDVRIGRKSTMAEFDAYMVRLLSPTKKEPVKDVIQAEPKKGINMPEIIHEHRKSFLFGLFKVSIIVEDRKAADPTRNFKHMINFSFLKYKYAIIIRSSSEGSYFINDKEV